MSDAMLVGVLIPAQTHHSVRRVEVGPGWQGLAAAIGTDFIQRAPGGLLDDHGLAVIVDGEGWLNGSRENIRASFLCWRPIAGDVLLLADGGEGFDSLPDPDETIALVREAWGGRP